MVGEALTQKRFPVEAVYRLPDVGEEVMGRMSHLSSPSPALAVLRIPQEKIQDNAPPPALPSGLCLGLDSVRDPGNAGTILRLADWFGIGTVYLSPDCVDLYNPKTVQATASPPPSCPPPPADCTFPHSPPTPTAPPNPSTWPSPPPSLATSSADADISKNFLRGISAL